MFREIHGGGKEIVRQAEQAYEDWESGDNEGAEEALKTIIEDCGTIKRQTERALEGLKSSV